MPVRKPITIIELIIIFFMFIILIKGFKYYSNRIQTGDMVLIKGGTFQMGEKGMQETVTVNDFYIGKYEVTNKEYCQYAPNRKNPGNNLPVKHVSWYDAVAYCEWLSEKTGKHYRLPTEAEWEYACRAGTTTKYFWGEEMDGSYCWYCDNSNDNLRRQIHPVGKKKPNAWSLYDMSGNVCEWCNDCYRNKYSTTSYIKNPISPANEPYRVLRGGGYYNIASYCSSTARNGYWPTERNGDLGFRLARSVP